LHKHAPTSYPSFDNLHHLHHKRMDKFKYAYVCVWGPCQWRPDEMELNRQRAPKESSPTLRRTFRGVNLTPIDRDVLILPVAVAIAGPPVFGNSNTQEGFSAPANQGKELGSVGTLPVVPIDEGFRLCSSVLVSVRFSYRVHHWLALNGKGVITLIRSLFRRHYSRSIWTWRSFSNSANRFRPAIPTERLGSSTPSPVLYP
jgi:hypothetical protein